MEQKKLPLDPMERALEKLDFYDTNGVAIENIPLPSEVPQPLNLEQIPEQILRSGAIDALISQNEDLMSRLTVGLKRNAVLEERLSRQERVAKALQHRNDVYKDRLKIIEEKDRVLMERMQKVDLKLEEYRKQIHLLELRHAELYKDAKEKQSTLRGQLDSLHRRLSRYAKYRRHMKRITEHNRDTLKQMHADAQRFQTLNAQLKTNVTELATRLQSVAKESTEQQKQLVNNYEDEILNLKRQILDQSKLQSQLVEKTNQIEDFHERNAELENKLISESRKLAETKSRLENDLQLLQVQVAEIRVENKARLLEVEDLKQVKQALQLELDEAKKEQVKTYDQIESIQCLWRDAQTQLERQIEKNQALQKLNQQLSTTLNQYRKEILTLQQRIDHKDAEMKEKLKELQGQLQVIAQMTAPNAGFDSKSADEKQQILNRIEDLMRDIHKGIEKNSGSN